MRKEPINQPIVFTWNEQQCIVVNNNMADVVLCMRVGTTSGVFSVHRSELTDLDRVFLQVQPTMMQQMQEKYKVKNQL